jgi:transposase
MMELTTQEQRELESRIRKYTSPYRDVIRAKIVLLAAQGLSNEVIASRLDTPRQIVSKWRKRFCLARLPGLEEEPRGGRPARFSPQPGRSS